MNVQIFGKRKCFETKKAERYFKERRIKVQNIDLPRFGMSPREFASVKQVVGLDALINPDTPGAELLPHLAYEADRVEKLLENPSLIRTPVVRNGKQATVGYCPEIWATWE